MTPICAALWILFFELTSTIISPIINHYPFFGVSYILLIFLSSKALLSDKKAIVQYLSLLCLFILASITIGSGAILPALSSLRVFIFFPVILVLSHSKQNEEKLFLIIILLMLLLNRFFFGTTDIIKYLELSKIYAARGTSSDGGIPFGFITSFGDMEVTRTWVGYFAADKGAYTAAAALILLVTFWQRSKSYSRGIYGLILIFFAPVLIFEVALVKAALLGLACIIVIVLLLHLGIGIRKSIAVLLLILALGISTVLVLVPHDLLSSSGAISHISGLIQPIIGIDSLSEFIYGNGAGKGGTLSTLAGSIGQDSEDLTKYDIGGESTIGSLIYQIGFGGLMFCCTLIYYFFKQHFTNNLKNQVFACSLIIVSFFSEAVTSIVAMLALKICADSLTDLLYKNSHASDGNFILTL